MKQPITTTQIPVKKVNKDPLDELMDKFNKLEIKLAEQAQNKPRNYQPNNRWNTQPNNNVKCYNCKKSGYYVNKCMTQRDPQPL